MVKHKQVCHIYNSQQFSNNSSHQNWRPISFYFFYFDRIILICSFVWRYWSSGKKKLVNHVFIMTSDDGPFLNIIIILDKNNRVDKWKSLYSLFTTFFHFNFKVIKWVNSFFYFLFCHFIPFILFCSRVCTCVITFFSLVYKPQKKVKVTKEENRETKPLHTKLIYYHHPLSFFNFVTICYCVFI